VGRGEQVGGAQDQQGRGQVADLERGERPEDLTELAVQHGADLDAQPAALGDLG
jgi:hypothetical protein